MEVGDPQDSRENSNPRYSRHHLTLSAYAYGTITPSGAIVPDDFRLAFRYRSVGFQHHISLAGFGLNSVVFDRLY